MSATVIHRRAERAVHAGGFFLLIGLLVDLLHRVLDPRLKSADDVTEVNA